jgi:hypothetical protein
MPFMVEQDPESPRRLLSSVNPKLSDFTTVLLLRSAINPCILSGVQVSSQTKTTQWQNCEMMLDVTVHLWAELRCR